MAKKLIYLKYQKIDSVTMRQLDNFTDPNCTDQSCSEEINSLGWNIWNSDGKSK